MKTFSKKLVSLMLVALMLVTVMPFAAFADETTQSAAGTEESVEVPLSDASLADASGNVNGDAAYQSFVGGAKIYAVVTVTSNTASGPVNLVTTADNKRYYVSDSFTYYKGGVATDLNIALQGLAAAGLNYGFYDVNSAVVQNQVMAIDVTAIKHDCNLYAKVQQIASNDPLAAFATTHHKLVCAVCGDSEEEYHMFATTASNVKFHSQTCSRCGYVLETPHPATIETEYQNVSDAANTYVPGISGVSEGYTVLVAATKATCTKQATYAKIKYDCGYTVGGEAYGATDAHTWDKGPQAGSKCVYCGTAYKGYVTYNVEINCSTATVNPIATGTVTLDSDDIVNIQRNTAGILRILSKTTSTNPNYQKLIDKYRNAGSDILRDMNGISNPITILVSKDLTDVDITSTTQRTIQIVDGQTKYDRTLIVGRYYFDQLKLSDYNRELVSMNITKANGTTRRINKTSIGTDAQVQADDLICELIWDANIVTLKFYRNAGGGSLLLETRQIRAGQTIDDLPLLDGKAVSWYLPNGTLLQAGRTYDFKDTTVNVYPKTSSSGINGSGDVYLLVYKNGDTKTAIKADPINVTQYLQPNGLISYADIKNVIASQATGDAVYFFDYEGWEDYKANKTTRMSNSWFNIGTDSDRGNVFLYAMVTGVKNTSSSNRADGSNPKTGDNAMLGTAAAVMTVAVLGLSATAVVLKKKEII